MSKFPICIDIDNVISQTDVKIRSLIKEATFGRVEYSYDDIIYFNYYECVDMKGDMISREEWELVHERFSTPEVLMSLELIQGAYESVMALSSVFQIHFVTSRLPSARIPTSKWLQLHGLGHHDLHFSEHRKKHLLNQHFSAIVEDDYDQAALFARSGVPSFLLSHPWNSHRDLLPLLSRSNKWDILRQQLMSLRS